MKVLIEFEPYEEIADPNHSSGVTNEGYEAILSALAPYGDDINIEKAAD